MDLTTDLYLLLEKTGTAQYAIAFFMCIRALMLPILWEAIALVIVRKDVHVSMCLILNGCGNIAF